MRTAITYIARALLAVGVVLLVRALLSIFLPITTPTPSATSIKEVFGQRLFTAGLVLAAALAIYLIGRSRKAAA